MIQTNKYNLYFINLQIGQDLNLGKDPILGLEKGRNLGLGLGLDLDLGQ